jgi:hypothetical protein
VTATSSDENNNKNPIADIHPASPKLAHPSDERSLGQDKGLSKDAPVKQAKPGLWTKIEITELQRLVGNNINHAGIISWVKVDEAWKLIAYLPVRSKASLSSKWRDIKSKLPILTVDDIDQTQGGTDNNQTQRSTDTNLANTITGFASNVTTTEASQMTDSNILGTKTTITVVIDDEEDQCTPVDSPDALIQLTFRKNLQKSRKIGCQMTLRKPPKRVSGQHIKPIICVVDDLIKSEIHKKGPCLLTWNQLSVLVYAGALTVSELGNQLTSEKAVKRQAWFSSSYRECDNLRKVIGKATAELGRRKKLRRKKEAKRAPTLQQVTNIRMLCKKYKAVSFAEITSLVEKLKTRLQLLQSKIALRQADEGRLRVRQMPAKMLLRSMETEDQVNTETPDVHRIRKYWETIVGVKKPFNSKNAQLQAWEQSLSQIPEDSDLKGHLTKELWDRVVRKAKPWKAHGPDGLQGYWWKVFVSANMALLNLVLHHLTSGESLPQPWITEGRIVLIHKAGPKSVPGNFRPIACLNTCYKLLTGYVTMYLNQHVTERNIMPKEQIALRGGVWGCTHALTLDQTLIADAQDQKQRPISVAWIDYAKAFDSVPHSYIKWLFSVIRIPDLLKKFLVSVMTNWRVRYEIRTKRGQTDRSNYLKIRSGVLQGDSFSPLLFCLAMAPISHAINNVAGAYVTASGKGKNLQLSQSHIFYMDDLKLYGNSRESLAKQIECVASISEDINMKLNAKKCARAHFTPKKLDANQVPLDPVATVKRSIDFPILDAELVYKYLGIEQRLGVKETEAWGRVVERCYKVAHNIWSSELTFRQKINTHNATVNPSLNYIASCIIKGNGKYASVLKRGGTADKKFRKVLVEHKVRYKANCVARLYLPVEQGGCGLRSVKDSLRESTIYSWAYLCTKPELRSSLNLFKNMAKRKKRCVISDAQSILKTYNIKVEIDEAHSTVILDGAIFVDAKTLARHVVSLMRTANNNMWYTDWRAKPLAGRVLNSTCNIDLIASFAWLKQGKLSSTAVRNVLAAQEGCLLTKTHPVHTKHSTDLSCRACKKSKETIAHVISSCPKWLPTLYVDRHDSAARNIYYKLCQKYGLVPPHYTQQVLSVQENENIKLYWNQPVQTKKIIRHNKPDIILFDKIKKTALIIEFAVSWFTGIERQMDIKTNRYCVNGNYDQDLNVPYPSGDNLLRELQTAGWDTSFLPIVIGATGEVLQGLSEKIKVSLGVSSEAADDCIERMQRSTALGTSRIIKNHLSKTAH